MSNNGVDEYEMVSNCSSQTAGAVQIVSPTPRMSVEMRPGAPTPPGVPQTLELSSASVDVVEFRSILRTEVARLLGDGLASLKESVCSETAVIISQLTSLQAALDSTLGHGSQGAAVEPLLRQNSLKSEKSSCSSGMKEAAVHTKRLPLIQESSANTSKVRSAELSRRDDRAHSLDSSLNRQATADAGKAAVTGVASLKIPDDPPSPQSLNGGLKFPANVNSGRRLSKNSRSSYVSHISYYGGARRPSTATTESRFYSSQEKSTASGSNQNALPLPPVSTSRRPSIVAALTSWMEPVMPTQGGRDVYSLSSMYQDRMVEHHMAGSDTASCSQSSERNLPGSECPSIFDSEDEGSPAAFTGRTHSNDSPGRRSKGMEDLRTDQEMTLMNSIPGSVVPVDAVGSMDPMAVYHTGTGQSSLSSGYSLTLQRWQLTAVQLLLYVFGIIPISASATRLWIYYSMAVITVVIAVVVHLVYVAVLEGDFLYLRLGRAVWSVGALLGLLALRRGNVAHLLGPEKRILEKYAISYNFMAQWRFAATKYLMYVVIGWLSPLLTWALIPWSEEFASCPDNQTDVALLSSVGGGLFAALIFCQLHVCFFLELTVDGFCLRLYESRDITDAVVDWNVVQAILRRAAAAVDKCLMLVQTAVLSAFLLLAAETVVGKYVFEGQARCALPHVAFGLPYLCLAFYGLARAAAVTEKCSRVPALINSLNFESCPLHPERQYLVQYVEHSAAGFYINGVRLTGFMVLKVAYGIAIATFAFATRFVEQ
eukprot:TRINITY_DN26654_c0_g1_i1.p1 TRINITY_DN26654_c0_g1~~TRINITY_DN26654_c0_g1_i1.p1  ORF type:complete len:768 (+),score=126.72 TRINITY_DN26654_c0_g1_i1:77-2380(+)